ncbi:MAG: acetylglutamate kinase [Bacteroidales bacterium]|nr:acetylglutamate kinase [Bacteroidales bacterium]
MMVKVYKIGGNVIENEGALEAFCKAFAAVPGRKVIVHGGGVMASSLQKALGQEPVKIEGRRVTDEDALKAVTMVYAGWCNKTIVSKLQSLGVNALGLSGCDGNVIEASRRAPKTLSDGKTVVDFGYVGDVTKTSVNRAFLDSLLDMGCVPVLCAINHDGKGQLLNTNADTVASSVAACLGAQLVCCFEMDGVLRDVDDPSSVIAQIKACEFEELVRDGVIADGMIPKIENCINSLRDGASKAFITNSTLASMGTEIVL